MAHRRGRTRERVRTVFVSAPSRARRRSSMARRRFASYRRRRSNGGGKYMPVILGALGTLAGMFVASKVGVPAQYSLAGGVALGGAALAATGHKSAGLGLIGAGAGFLALPYVMGIGGGGSSAPAGGQVWA